MTSNRDKVKQFANQQALNDSRNAQALQDIVDDTSSDYMDWWSDFLADYPDFDQGDYSGVPNQDLVSYLDSYAKQNGQQPVKVSNVDQMIEYAVILFTTVVAYKAIKKISSNLNNEANKTAQFGFKTYDVKSKPIDRTLVNTNFEGVNWSNSIWKNQSALRADLSNIMRQSLLQGQNPVTYTKQLKEKFGVQKYQAERILRTESARVSALQQVKNLKNAGFEYMEWVTGGGACRYCMEMDGKVFKAVDFGEGRYTIPQHPNCRCSVTGFYKQNNNDDSSSDDEDDD
ncbi:Uncharacterized protein LMG30237_ALEAABJJ_00411 [Fructobacillus tropaeoli]|uniref:minor capsid protein n=1 Tax=Fructobacillus tropaeoli TaxID=709323 RepID=UPI002D9180F3|nr:Uncharacterized protein LMG30237_ALEAABJJ_00411 [Fructobacillus tropaeoli]